MSFEIDRMLANFVVPEATVTEWTPEQRMLAAMLEVAAKDLKGTGCHQFDNWSDRDRENRDLIDNAYKWVFLSRRDEHKFGSFKFVCAQLGLPEKKVREGLRNVYRSARLLEYGAHKQIKEGLAFSSEPRIEASNFSGEELQAMGQNLRKVRSSYAKV